METEVRIETTTYRGCMRFSEAKLVTRTAAHLVVALTNASGERLVITLPKAMLKELGDWRDLL